MSSKRPHESFYDYSLPEADPVAWLNSLVDFETAAVGISAGVVDGLSLEPMRALMAALGDPQDSYRVIHITGTNGKGSTAIMVSSLLQALGLSVGVYSSPDQGDVRQRLAINGRNIPDDEFGETLAEVANAAQIVGDDPTRFEALTASALAWFSHHAVDVAVVEVGLLGRFDATNVVAADVAVITSLGKDHTDGTDGWPMRVLGEKVGIIEPTSDVVVGGVDISMLPIVEAESPNSINWRGRDFWVEAARIAVGGRLIDVVTPFGAYREVLVPVHGGFQDGNVAVAIAACEQLVGRALPADVVEEGLANVVLSGRVEVVSRQPLVVLDGAHNAHAAKALAQTVSDEFMVAGSRILVIGMLRGKSPREFLEPFAASGWDVVIAASLPGPRGLAAADIAAAALQLGLAAEVVNDPSSAVARAMVVADEDDLVVISGSIRMVPAARGALAALRLST